MQEMHGIIELNEKDGGGLTGTVGRAWVSISGS